LIAILEDLPADLLPHESVGNFGLRGKMIVMSEFNGDRTGIFDLN
jgi:hypothetical protein